MLGWIRRNGAGREVNIFEVGRGLVYRGDVSGFGVFGWSSGGWEGVE